MATALFDIPVHRLDGAPDSLAPYRGSVVLVVNVASACGLTPQYESLEKAFETYRDRGFVVLGFPCNQFGAQEPGTSDEIATFCSTKYDVKFPLFEKIDVNGEDQSPIYAELNQTADAEGYTGDVRWNFEKFLIGPDASVQRFSPTVTPDDPVLVGAIETALG